MAGGAQVDAGTEYAFSSAAFRKKKNGKKIRTKKIVTTGEAVTKKKIPPNRESLRSLSTPALKHRGKSLSTPALLNSGKTRMLTQKASTANANFVWGSPATKSTTPKANFLLDSIRGNNTSPLDSLASKSNAAVPARTYSPVRPTVNTNVVPCSGSPIRKGANSTPITKSKGLQEYELDLSSSVGLREIKKPWETDIQKKHKTEYGDRLLRDGPSSADRMTSNRLGSHHRVSQRSRSLSVRRHRSVSRTRHRHRSPSSLRFGSNRFRPSEPSSGSEDDPCVGDDEKDISDDIETYQVEDHSYDKYRHFLSSTKKNEEDEGLSRRSVMALQKKVGAAPSLNFSYRYLAAADETLGLGKADDYDNDTADKEESKTNSNIEGKTVIDDGNNTTGKDELKTDSNAGKDAYQNDNITGRDESKFDNGGNDDINDTDKSVDHEEQKPNIEDNPYSDYPTSSVELKTYELKTDVVEKSNSCETRDHATGKKDLEEDSVSDGIYLDDDISCNSQQQEDVKVNASCIEPFLRYKMKVQRQEEDSDKDSIYHDDEDDCDSQQQENVEECADKNEAVSGHERKSQRQEDNSNSENIYHDIKSDCGSLQQEGVRECAGRNQRAQMNTASQEPVFLDDIVRRIDSGDDSDSRGSHCELQGSSVVVEQGNSQPFVSPLSSPNPQSWASPTSPKNVSPTQTLPIKGDKLSPPIHQSKHDSTEIRKPNKNESSYASARLSDKLERDDDTPSTVASEEEEIHLNRNKGITNTDEYCDGYLDDLEDSSPDRKQQEYIKEYVGRNKPSPRGQMETRKQEYDSNNDVMYHSSEIYEQSDDCQCEPIISANLGGTLTPNSDFHGKDPNHGHTIGEDFDHIFEASDCGPSDSSKLVRNQTPTSRLELKDPSEGRYGINGSSSNFHNDDVHNMDDSSFEEDAEEDPDYPEEDRQLLSLLYNIHSI